MLGNTNTTSGNGGGTRRYRKLLELGHGGMADVWLGMHNGLAGFRKLLVIKKLRDYLVDNLQLREMLLEEARIAARLNHPNVVQTLEVGEEDDEFFIVMEFLEGQSLKAVRRVKPMPLAMELTIISNVLAGLEYAHDLCDFDGTKLCLVHRDVSPDNVFVTYEGQVKLVDFGVAKTRMSSSVTRVGHFKGKLAYMPPEQAYNHSVDHRADLFAVGVMLWEAITETRMWENTPDETVIHLLGTGAIPKLAEIKSDAPVELIQICTRALAPNKESRYASAAEFRADVQTYLTTIGGPVDAKLIGAHVAGSFAKERRHIRTVIEGDLNRDTERGTGPPPLPLGRRGGARKKYQLPDPYSISWRVTDEKGEVYEGVHDRLDRKVRIEVCPDIEDVEAFVQLMDGSASLNHPNTARILHVGALEDSDGVYVVREHIDGSSLKSLIAEKEGALGGMRMLGLGIQVLLSLCESHANNDCHGRLEPSNIFLCKNSGGGEHVKVSGYAGKITRPNEEISRRYQAPEVLAGKKPTAASDVFSTALILYECLTGNHPFHDFDEMASAYRQMHDPLPEATERIWEVDGLREWLERALNKNQGERYKDAREMLAAASSIDSDALSRAAQELGDSGFDGSLVRADYDVVLTPPETRVVLKVNRNSLASLTRPSVWVLSDDPAIRNPLVTVALAELQERVDLQVITAERCAELRVLLQEGKILPPWVVVFGDLHVMLGEELLTQLSESAEVSRILISTHANAEMLQESINACGLDQQVCLPAEPDEVATAIDEMLARSHRQRGQYDQLRRSLLTKREERGKLNLRLAEKEVTQRASSTRSTSAADC